MADLILSDCIGLPRHLAVGRADVAMRREFDSTKNCLYKSFFIPKSRLPEFESQLKPGQILLIYDDSPDNISRLYKGDRVDDYRFRRCE